MKQELLKIMKERRSVRSYKKDLMIPEDVLQEILETATYAPTGGGRQSPVIIAVTDKTMRDHITHLNAKIMGDENADPFYEHRLLRWFWQMAVRALGWKMVQTYFAI